MDKSNHIALDHLDTGLFRRETGPTAGSTRPTSPVSRNPARPSSTYISALKKRSRPPRIQLGMRRIPSHPSATGALLSDQTGILSPGKTCGLIVFSRSSRAEQHDASPSLPTWQPAVASRSLPQATTLSLTHPRVATAIRPFLFSPHARACQSSRGSPRDKRREVR